MVTYQGKYGFSSFTRWPLTVGMCEMEMLLNDHATALMFRVDELRYTVIADSYPTITLEAAISDYGN